MEAEQEDGDLRAAEGGISANTDRGTNAEAEKKRAAEDESWGEVSGGGGGGGGGGVSRLTGSPKVLGLHPPSVYRCPAETEGTTELHTPPSTEAPPTAVAPRGRGPCTCSPYRDETAQAVHVCKSCSSKRQRGGCLIRIIKTCMQSSSQ